MSFAAENWAWEQQCDSKLCSASAAKLVLLCLAWYANKEGEKAFPSIPTICKRTDLAERTVRRALEALEAEGLIQQHLRDGDNPEKRRLTSEYRLIIRDTPLVNLPGEGSSKSTGGGVVDLHPPPSKSASPPPANLLPELYIEPSKEEESKGNVVALRAPRKRDPFTLLIDDWESRICDACQHVPPDKARGIIGWLRKNVGDNFAAIDAAIRRLEAVRPSGNLHGFFRRVIPGFDAKTSTYDQIREDGNLPSFLVPKPDYECLEATQ